MLHGGSKRDFGPQLPNTGLGRFPFGIGALGFQGQQRDTHNKGVVNGITVEKVTVALIHKRVLLGNVTRLQTPDNLFGKRDFPLSVFSFAFRDWGVETQEKMVFEV
jgi:hypothetical protein